MTYLQQYFTKNLKKNCMHYYHRTLFREVEFTKFVF
jgi:hypothetical protein